MQTDQEKRAIRAAFANAAPNYDGVAQVQRRIADSLLTRCEATKGIALDAGSGTGYATPKLGQLSATCVALDHATPMLTRSLGKGVCGDIEALPLRPQSIGLYYSSLAWQWTDASRAISEAARVLQPAGWLAVATLGPDSLRELREAFRHADDKEHVRRFAPVDSYIRLLDDAGLNSIKVERATFLTHAPDFRTLLQDIRQLGARVVGGIRPPGLFGVQGFRRAEAHYESLRETAGLPLTYDVVFVTARRQS